MASITGGINPYVYQWYNNTACTSIIANQINSSYTTNILNSTTPLSYCLKVNDSAGELARASINISVSHSLATSQGEVVSAGNATVLIAPSIVAQNNGYLIENATPWAIFNVSVCGTRYTAYETSLTPSYVYVSINGASYNLSPSSPVALGSGCDVELENISWSPFIHLSSLSFYTAAPPTTTSVSTTSSSSVSTSSSTSVSTSSTTSIIPLSAKITSSNTPSNTIKVRAVKSLDNFVVSLVVLGVVIFGGVVFVIYLGLGRGGKSKPREPVVPTDPKTGMVNL
jgi:hypothetical protein